LRSPNVQILRVVRSPLSSFGFSHSFGFCHSSFGLEKYWPMTDTEAKTPDAPGSLVEGARLVFLDLKKLHFCKHGVTLRLTVEEDRSYLKVSVLRAFPLSEPNRFFSVRDGANREVGMIVDPAELSDENLELVREEIARRYLVPAVKRILTAKERFGTVDWEMETDRGVRKLTTRNLRENVKRPAPGRILLSDVDGNRYDVHNIDELDLNSQQL